MTDKTHEITPPPELVRDWAQKAQLLAGDDPEAFAELLCNKTARWGADQELGACVEWMKGHLHSGSQLSKQLRDVRRPQAPPSLKEQSLALIDKIQGNTEAWDIRDLNLVRRALETLND